MSDKIRISVSDLRAQAAELSAIASDFEDQYRTAVNAMQNMKSAMSVAMALNMEMKSRRMILYFSSLNVTLQQGVSIANTSATSFENTDVTLRKLYSNWLPSEVKSTTVSQQAVTGPYCSDIDYSGKVGERVAGIYDSDGNMRDPYYKYWDKDVASYSGGDLECTHYAKGRFEERTGVALDFNRDAISYKDDYIYNDKLTWINSTDISNLRPPAIAVTKGNSYHGHVVVIEDLTYNTDGSIDKILFTEANAAKDKGASDGVLKSKSFSEFYGGGYLTPYGFIQLK